MTDSQWTSIVATLMMGLLLLGIRKNLRTCNCLSVFLATHLVFVFSGLLLFPWLLPYLGEMYQIGESSSLDLFHGVRIDVFSDQDITKAIWLSIGGGIITVLSYRASQSVWAGRRSRPRRSVEAETIATVPQTCLGFSPHRLRLYSGIVALTVFVLLWNKRGDIQLGVVQGFLNGRNDAVIEARYAMSQGGYILFVLCCNVLPFFAAAEWLTYRMRKNRTFRIYPYALVTLTVVGMVFLFQKRPLLVFLGTLALLDYLRHSGLHSVRRPWLSFLYNQRSKMLICRVLLMFAVLSVLYWMSTSVGRSGESLTETIYVLGAISFTRILGRLSIPAVFYAHYFPHVDPHYGISNIGLVTKLLQMDIYADTSLLFRYFNDHHDSGSVAIFAIMDFYGGFGWFGWLIGCTLLGVLLQRLDNAIHKLNPSAAKDLARVFAYIFVYYLSQSSLPRASWGYGGLFFLACWCLLTFSNRKSRQGVVGRRRAFGQRENRISNLAGVDQC